MTLIPRLPRLRLFSVSSVLSVVHLLGLISIAPAATHLPTLEAGFRNPPSAARPHAYWLWLNGHVHLPTALDELTAMRDAGLGGVLLFEMGARGDPAHIPSPGPAFLSPEWVQQLRTTTDHARKLGLQVDMSVISSWDMGGPWIEPKHAVMGLYSTETTATAAAGTPLTLTLPFPTPERAAPLGPDGKPAFWTDVAVLAIRQPQRLPSHDFVLRLDPQGDHDLAAIVLDQGTPNAPAPLAATMTGVREFSLSIPVSENPSPPPASPPTAHSFTEILRATLKPEPGPQRFPLPPGTRASHVRLQLLSGHDAARPRWTLAEFEVLDPSGRNLALSHRADQTRDGALLVSSPVPLTYTGWSAGKIHDNIRTGANGVFATAGLPSFDIPSTRDIIDVTQHVDRTGRLTWNDAPPGQWTILRYVCMVTGEKLKVPSPASDGLASDHLNPEATRVHMNNVIAKLRAGLGNDLTKTGIENLYLASYEVVGRVWSPVFAAEFKRRRGYDLTPWLPAIFGARIGNDDTTSRFLFDYRKTLGEVVVDAYYRTAVEVARAAGLKIKSEAGGPGPPIHTPPMDALLAHGTVDNVQGEFWPFWPDNDAINVIKEPASAAHLYGKPRVHLEAFTSFHHWAESPQDLKPSADRVFTEGGNHFVWHTWTHQAPTFGLPGLVYGAGTHLNRNVTWWPKAKPFLDYLARGSFLLQRGRFVADVLYYYGDAGMNFVPPRRNPSTLGPGYDYDVTNADALLRRLSVRDGRLTTPEGVSYALLVLPDTDAIHPPVLEKIESLVRAGATVLARQRPTRATGLENHPASDTQVQKLAAQLWSDLDGRIRKSRTHGKGRVYLNTPEREILTALNIAPDFLAPPALDFTHRRDTDAEIYFVRNKTASPVTAPAAFRDSPGTASFWDPMHGTIRPLPATRAAPHTTVPLSLAAHGSGFVIFRKESSTSSPATSPSSTAALPAPVALERTWKVDFIAPAKFETPPPLELIRVGPWTENTGPEHRYFTGSAKYRHTFTLPPNFRTNSPRVTLDLGHLWAIGEVHLNGKSLGILWAPPFSVDVTSTLRDGENELVVEVTGTWHNRLVGEARSELPKLTRTNITVSQRKPWKDLDVIPAGLFGPVRLVPITP